MDLQYMIVKASKTKKLEALVQSRLNEGWELQGGISIAGIELSVQFCQALVLRKK